MVLCGVIYGNCGSILILTTNKAKNYDRLNH